jgi:hypothetical protein
VEKQNFTWCLRTCNTKGKESGKVIFYSAWFVFPADQIVFLLAVILSLISVFFLKDLQESIYCFLRNTANQSKHQLYLCVFSLLVVENLLDFWRDPIEISFSLGQCLSKCWYGPCTQAGFEIGKIQANIFRLHFLTFVVFTIVNKFLCVTIAIGLVVGQFVSFIILGRTVVVVFLGRIIRWGGAWVVLGSVSSLACCSSTSSASTASSATGGTAPG